MGQYFQTQQIDDVELLTLTRENALNALNPEMIQELTLHFKKPKSRCIVLTGTGKSFVAGADIHAMQSMELSELKDFSRQGHELMDTIAACPSIVIAAVNGYALGGGFELALACDFIYASTKAKFGFPEVKLGLIPGFGGIQRIIDTAGRRKSKELLLTGITLKASEAKEIGICNKIIEPNELIETAIESAKLIASHSPNAVQETKQCADHGLDQCLREVFQKERDAFAACFDTEIAKKTLKQFVEKKQ